MIMSFFEMLLFVFTFYFTIIRLVTWTILFNKEITSFPKHLGLEDNGFTSIIHVAMWLYQLIFWFQYFKIL